MQGEEAFELQDWVELSNGCLCCSVKNEFVQALEALMHRRDKFDAGLADPGPVAAALWTDAELESGVCLDAIVTVVDACHIQQQLLYGPANAAEHHNSPGGEAAEEAAVNEAQLQVAYADVILLNKVGTVIV